jgi:uncharacterized protein
MLKYLLLAIVIIWLFYSPALRGRRTGQVPAKRPAPPAAEAMVQCAHCGVHLPAGDALLDAKGQAYCSVAHRASGPGPGQPMSTPD